MYVKGLKFRTSLLVFALIGGHFAMALGDAWRIAGLSTASGFFYAYLLLATVAGALLAVAIWLFMLVTTVFENRSHIMRDPEPFAVSAISFAGLLFLFGVIAVPFTRFGAWPWQWHTWWVVIPIFGCIPLAVLTYYLALEIAAEVRLSLLPVPKSNRKT